MLELTSRLLRDPDALVERARDPEVLAELVPRLLGITALAAGLFGAVVGSYRGGLQIAYVAVKMPLLLLVPTLIALPALKGLWQASEVDLPYSRLAVAGLVGMARTAVLAGALGPLVWLLYSSGLGYHLAVLLLAGVLVACGLPGLGVVVRSLEGSGGRRRLFALLGGIGVFCALSAQTGWLLRPFVARPTAEVAFLRPVESDIFSALAHTTLSSVGAYPGWEAERSGLLARPEDR